MFVIFSMQKYINVNFYFTNLCVAFVLGMYIRMFLCFIYNHVCLGWLVLFVRIFFEIGRRFKWKESIWELNFLHIKQVILYSDTYSFACFGVELRIALSVCFGLGVELESSFNVRFTAKTHVCWDWLKNIFWCEQGHFKVNLERI